jgi:subtilisin family serine protease
MAMRMLSEMGGVAVTAAFQIEGATDAARTLEVVALPALMDRTRGSANVAVALVDGPVALDHPDLTEARIQTLGGYGRCLRASSYACTHGTFVAGMLVGRRGSSAPAIAPECPLMVRPIFGEGADGVPGTTPGELAAALQTCIDAGARVINLSAALLAATVGEERELGLALDLAATRGVLVVAAAGNQALVGSSPLTRHPWVIPVVACDASGRPMAMSNLGRSIGNGLSAPGNQVVSLGSNGGTRIFSGTSAAAPFVSGAAALLCSLFPRATGQAIRLALCSAGRRRSIVPPLLDAWKAHRILIARTL